MARPFSDLILLIAVFVQALVFAECTSATNHPPRSSSIIPPVGVQLEVPESVVSINGGGARNKASTGNPSSESLVSKMKNIFAYDDDNSSSGVKSRKPLSISSAPGAASSANERAFITSLVMMLASPYIAPIIEEFYKYVHMGLKATFQKVADIGDEILALIEDLADEFLHFMKLTGDFFASTSTGVSVFIFERIDAALAAIADLGYEIKLMVARTIVSPIATISSKLSGDSVGVAKSFTRSISGAGRNTKNFVTMCGRETVWFVEDVLDFANDNIQVAASSTGKLMRSMCQNFYSGIRKSASCVTSCVLYLEAAIRSAIILGKEECVSFSKYIAQCIVEGTEAVCNSVAAAARYTAEKVVDGLENTAISFVEGFEWTLFVIFLAFSRITLFAKIVSKFLTTSAVYYAETTGNIAGTTIRKIGDGVSYVKEEFPEWVLDFADAMPFLEIRKNNDIALTKTAQAILFLATAVVAFHPYFNEEPDAPTNRYGFIKAYEQIKSRFFPSRRLVLVGALARGLHQQSSFAYTFQPSLGAGALMNIGAIISDERWFSFVLAGWFASGQIWTFFGAETPNTKSLSEGTVGVIKKKKGGWF